MSNVQTIHLRRKPSIGVVAAFVLLIFLTVLWVYPLYMDVCRILQNQSGDSE